MENISLQQCLRVFKGKPIVIVKPSSLELSGEKWMTPEIVVESFEDENFKDIGGYSRLLLSPFFYKRFSQFDYMLIYQLDAFVFHDQLHYWCEKEFDYMGAPWFENFNSEENAGRFIGVGNGGFSLRKISSHLKALKTFSFVTSIGESYRNRFKTANANGGLIKKAGSLVLDHTVRNNTHWLFNNFRGHEDQFWGLAVAKKFKWFKVPDLKQATSFAFEMQPRRLFRENNEQLPFGCHAWWKYDLEFWKPHIERLGYIIGENDR